MRLTVMAGAGTLLLPVPHAGADGPLARVALDRLTYVDGLHRTGTDPRFVRLGFDAVRSSEAVALDIPELHSPHLIATGEGPDQLQTVSVDLERRGDLGIVMLQGPAPAYPRPVRGSASEGGMVKQGTAQWTIPDADPGTYTFSVLYRARGMDLNLGSFLPESRISLRTDGSDSTLVFKEHVAPTYGDPEIDPGRAFGPRDDTEIDDEWVVQPSYAAQGIHHWSTGRITEVRDFLLSRLAPGSQGALNSGSMGSACSGCGKVVAVQEFIYEVRPLRIYGFSIGATTADIFGPIPPFTANARNGWIYDGDGATLSVSASAGSAHWDKGTLRNDRGELRWDWDGVWAEGWGTQEDHELPGLRRRSERIYSTETVLYPGAHGGDVDNRDGKAPIRGPRWYLTVPNSNIGFISWGGAAPPRSKYFTEGGWAPDGRFFLRPRIGRGGYMLEGHTDGYFRQWQPPVFIGGHFFGATPEDGDESEDAVATRLFSFPPNSVGHIGVAATSGVVKHFEVGAGLWQVSATLDDIRLRRINLR